MANPTINRYDPIPSSPASGPCLGTLRAALGREECALAVPVAQDAEPVRPSSTSTPTALASAGFTRQSRPDPGLPGRDGILRVAVGVGDAGDGGPHPRARPRRRLRPQPCRSTAPGGRAARLATWASRPPTSPRPSSRGCCWPGGASSSAPARDEPTLSVADHRRRRGGRRGGRAGVDAGQAFARAGDHRPGPGQLPGRAR